MKKAAPKLIETAFSGLYGQIKSVSKVKCLIIIKIYSLYLC